MRFFRHLTTPALLLAAALLLAGPAAAAPAAAGVVVGVEVLALGSVVDVGGGRLAAPAGAEVPATLQSVGSQSQPWTGVDTTRPPGM